MQFVVFRISDFFQFFSFLCFVRRCTAARLAAAASAVVHGAHVFSENEIGTNLIKQFSTILSIHLLKEFG
jgi:hypothetical protein